MDRCRIAALIQRWHHAQGGNVAVIFAIAAVPLIGAVGTAVDYSHASAVRTSMQAALDATALLLAKNAGNQTAEEMQKLGEKYFNAQFKPKGAKKSTTITVVYNQGSSTVQVSGNASISTSFMAVMGFKNLGVTASATAKWGAKTRLRVALVLDNTGSMSKAGKMKALQTAAKNLLAKLNSAATTSGDVYVSIIPFARSVNVGSGNSGASWVGWRLWEETNGSCSKSSYDTQSKCTENKGTWTPSSHSKWNGCIADRDKDYDITNVAPKASDATLPPTTPSTLFPAFQDDTCPVQLQPMTNNWSALSNLVNAMSPSGKTNQAVGLAWGWLSLTQGSILDPPGYIGGYSYNNHILLLTDGMNTENRFTTDQDEIDARQAMICDKIKADGITLWTIQVNTDGDPTSKMLQDCASDPGKFFLLTSADQIISTFDNISFKITQLHIAK